MTTTAVATAEPDDKAAITAIVDQLIAAGLPKVYVFYYAPICGWTITATTANSVTRWAHHLGVTPTVRVIVDPAQRKIFQGLDAAGELNGAKVTIAYTSVTRIIGSPGATVVTA